MITSFKKSNFLDTFDIRVKWNEPVGYKSSTWNFSWTSFWIRLVILLEIDLERVNVKLKFKFNLVEE